MDIEIMGPRALFIYPVCGGVGVTQAPVQDLPLDSDPALLTSPKTHILTTKQHASLCVLQNQIWITVNNSNIVPALLKQKVHLIVLTLKCMSVSPIIITYSGLLFIMNRLRNTKKVDV